MKLSRKTFETQVELEFEPYGKGQYEIQTPIPFFTHMLEQFAKHGRFNLNLTVTGDDPHHIIEDVGILLGKAFNDSLPDKTGIERFADSLIPMDEALVRIAIDLSGRSYLAFNATFPSAITSGFETEWCLEFMTAFLQNAKMALHITTLAGKNTHHMLEAIFKGTAITLRRALMVTSDSLPSTKGVL